MGQPRGDAFAQSLGYATDEGWRCLKPRPGKRGHTLHEIKSPPNPTIKRVTFEPLSTNDIHQLAAFYGATSAPEFATAFDGSNVAEFMDVRPRNVQLSSSTGIYMGISVRGPRLPNDSSPGRSQNQILIGSIEHSTSWNTLMG
jgi:hypothetical protein